MLLAQGNPSFTSYIKSLVLHSKFNKVKRWRVLSKIVLPPSPTLFSPGDCIAESMTNQKCGIPTHGHVDVFPDLKTVPNNYTQMFFRQQA